MNSRQTGNLLAAACLICALALIAQAFFYVLVPFSAWSASQFPHDVRLSIILYELTLTVLAMGIPAVLVLWVGRCLPPVIRLPVGVALLWVLFAFIAASWLFYVASGAFLGVDALIMWWRNFGQMWQHIMHIAPLVLLWLTIGSLLLAIMAVFALALLRRFEDRRAFRVAAMACIPVALLFAVAAVWPSFRVSAERLDAYQDIKHRRNGPFAFLTYSVAAKLFQPPVAPVPGWAEPFFQRPERITLGDWLERVEPTRVQRHNVILLLIESLRRDALTTFGGERNAMPTVDRLATDGRRYMHAFAQASHSNYADPVPLSSHYPLRSAQTYTYPKVYTYPRVLIYDLLKPLGWRTAIFSSQNESWGGMANYLDTGNLDRFLHSETYDGPTYVPRYDKWFVDWMQGDKRSGKIDDRFTVGKAIDWIENGGDKPFFIYMNLQSSHLPYDVPEDFDKPFDLPEGVTSIETQPGLMRILGDGDITQEQKVAAMKTLYLNSLAYVDSQLSRLVAALERKGILDETIIVISADTGQAFFEHGYMGHGNLPHNEVVRVPLVLHGPGMETGDDYGVTQHVDVPPTLLSLLGLPPHPSFQGVDLTAVPLPERPPAFVVTQTPIAEALAVVWRQWKYIYDLEARKAMLFDVGADPYEQHNLVGKAPAGLVPALGRLLGVWRRAQITYYQDVARHGREYPPRLAPDFDLRKFFDASRFHLEEATARAQ